MGHALKDNWALFTGMVMLMAANGLLSTLLSLRGAEIGFAAAQIGVMQAGYPLGALLGCVMAPRLIARVGHVRVFGALASLCSVAAVVHLITDDFGVWTAMRLLAGFCFPGLYVIAESWLNAKVSNRQRAAVLSVYFVIQTAGGSAGQSLAGLNGGSGAFLFALTSILISMSLVPLLLSANPAPDYTVPERMPVTRLLRLSPTSVIGSVLNGAGQAAFYIAVPLYGLALGMDAPQATALLVTGTLAGAAVQFPIGWLSDRIDRRLVVAGLSGITLLAMVSGLRSDMPFVTVALLAASLLPVYSLCVAYANDQLNPGQIVAASGTLVLTLNVGILFGAFTGPYVLGAFGPAGFLLFFAGLAALTGATALGRRARGPAVEATAHARAVGYQGSQSVAAWYLAAGGKNPGDTSDKDVES